MKIRNTPYPVLPKYNNSQTSVPIDNSPKLPLEKVKRIQKIIGSFLYAVRAVDNTIVKELNSLASQQSTATKKERN